jgi:hypothetical protein
LALQTSQAEEAHVEGVPGAVPLKFDEKLSIAGASKPVKLARSDLHIVQVGTGIFRLSQDNRLTATLYAAVAEYAKVEYRISVAVFDAQARLLGAAAHVEKVEYTRLGSMPTMFREIALDFGSSESYRLAASIVVAISEPKVPVPPDEEARRKAEQAKAGT